MPHEIKHTRFRFYEYYWLLRHGWSLIEVVDGVAKMVKEL